MVEAGFTRAKNMCNIIMKNLMDISLGSLIFWMISFGLMFGASSGWIGRGRFSLMGHLKQLKQPEIPLVLTGRF